MAKMHSRARGKSGSTKPVKKIPSWAPYKGPDVEKLIVKYSKAGKNTSEIGKIEIYKFEKIGSNLYRIYAQ